MDKEFLQTTFDDLVHIRETFKPFTRKDEIRRSSIVLRRLLVDGDLCKAWKEAGFTKQPKIVAPTLKHHLEHPNGPDIYIAAALGGTLESATLTHLCLFKHKPEMKIELPKWLSTQKPALPTTDYVESCSIVFKGKPFSRREIVKFVSNKLGGAHFDTRERAPELEEVISLDIELSGVTGRERRDIIFFEILSIGQFVVSSPDVKLLVHKVETILKQSPKN